MIVVDTSVWIDHFAGVMSAEVVRLHNLLGAAPIVVGDIVLCEILQGARSEQIARDLQRRLEWFNIEPMLSPELAMAAAENYRFLRSKGPTIRTVDLIIGTYCIERALPLLHRDSDFDRMAAHLPLRMA